MATKQLFQIFFISTLYSSGGCQKPSTVANIETETDTNIIEDRLDVTLDTDPFFSVQIDGVPHITQKPDFCGEACAAMYLQKLGETVDQDYVFDMAGVDPSLGRGAYAAELNHALTTIGFKTGQVWYPINSSADVHMQFQALFIDLTAQIPSIVCMNTSDTPSSTEHFRLILGYDKTADEIIYHEPALANGAYQRMARKDFESLWPLGGRPKTIVRMRLEIDALAYGEISKTNTPADFSQHVMGKRDRVPPGFTIVVEPPFIIIGDESADIVRIRAATTVRRTVSLLKDAFFSQDPDEILDIWLFQNDTSYRKWAKEIFNHTPNTPYGYYSESDKSLIMNIATGGGTLVHEIVHPYVRANFPKCPAWLNEGLGSLYEACEEVDGHIRGRLNWRLPGLKQAIGAGTLPPFKELTATTDHQFYESDPGSNYAQSRYLLYYLQEKGKLVSYYHTFFRNRHIDPTGFATLKQVLGVTDMNAFQADWEAWVLNLDTIE